MKILVSGSTGMIGSELVDALIRNNDQPVRLVRRKGTFAEEQVTWNISSGQLDPKQLQGIDAVVHLAGENIAGGRWTPERKKAIVDSRVQGTRLLAQTLAKMENPPKTMVVASAIGYYGNHGDEWLTEVSSAGHGFLAETCKAWEAAAQPEKDKGIRVVHTRFGMVMSPKGGALKCILPPFKLGVAGELGNGKQYMSWVSLQDVVGALVHVIQHAEIQGPVNVTAPNPVTNREFTRSMRQQVTCPLSPFRIWAPPAPAIALKAILGDMAEDLLLSSARVKPVVLKETGYTFQFTELPSYLKTL